MKTEHNIRMRLIRAVCLMAAIALSICVPFAISARANNVNNTIPRITDTVNPVIVITGDVSLGSQAGYPSLAAAMAGIGNGTDDYTIVFAQNYTMVPGTDRDATVAYGKHAASLTVTSTCYIGTAATATTSTVQAAGVTYASDLSFNADTMIHDFNITTSGGPTVHMLGNGHKFTIGDNVNTVGRVQLYGGGDAPITGNTELTVNSGTFPFVMAGGRNGTVTGIANATIGGTATVDRLYAGSQSVVVDADFTGNLTIKDDAVINNICGSYKQDGIPVGATVNVILDGATNIKMLTPDYNNKGTANITVKGESAASGTTTATNLDITDNASFTTGTGTANGALTLKGNMTLGSGSAYIHAGNSTTQQVNGDLIVNGPGAKLTLFKKNSTASTLPLTIDGAYQTLNTLDITLYNDVPAADGDVLLTFTTPANADGDNYNDYYCTGIQTLFGTEKSSTNPAEIIYQKIYTRHSYYVPVAGITDLYSFTAVGNVTATDGGSHTEYRKLQDNKWYEADASGNIIGSPINTELDRPQPNPTYRANFNESKATMIRIDDIGFYRITAAVGTNAYGDSRSGVNSASGNSEHFYNIDSKGTLNASWAILKQTSPTCSIKRAFLIMTTTLDANGSAEDILNTPMKLIAPNNDSMLSNGYLPEGFSIAIPGSAGSQLTSNTPTLLFDRAPSRADLGEAMTITDVTDFVKSHGYGKYYGVDIPADGIDVDAVIGWRLVVIEADSDPLMNYMRKVAVQIGTITNSQSTTANPAVIDLNMNGLTTPSKFAGAFGGQVLMIGSDNLVSGQATHGSNLHNTFYPDPVNHPTVAIKIGSNNPDTIGIDRPQYYWSQGHVDIDGINLPDDQMSHIAGGTSKYVGIDMQLLNLTNTENLSWDTDGPDGGGHNLYLFHESPSIRLSSVCDGGGIGYIDTLALSTDIETPEFFTKISHTDDSAMLNEGVDVAVGKTVIVNAVAINTTSDESSVLGAIDARVVIEIDSKLSDIRDIKAVFTSGENRIIIVGVYNTATHSIEFDFGQDFLAPDGNTYQRFNIGRDTINISFKATTNDTPTVNDNSVEYTNKISVYGTDIYKKAHPAGFVHLHDNACYVTDSDSFNTFDSEPPETGDSSSHGLVLILFIGAALLFIRLLSSRRSAQKHCE